MEMNREEIVKELESLRETIRTANSTTFVSASKKVLSMHYIENALALLKAQEPIEPVFERQFMSCIKIYDCGKCGTSLGAKGIAKYCMECGRAVKWE